MARRRPSIRGREGAEAALWKARLWFLAAMVVASVASVVFTEVM